jgi:serine phosphatase RsbU (regulator of sigma subunit)
MRNPRFHPLLALALGVLVLAAGVAMARQWLPEWRSDLPGKGFFVHRYRELARQGGIRLIPGAPRISLVNREQNDKEGREALEGLSPDLLASLGEGLRVQVEQEGTTQPGGSPLQLSIQLSPSGQPRFLSWSPRGVDIFKKAVQNPTTSPEPVERFLRLLLGPGESLGTRRQRDFPRNQLPQYLIQGSRPPQHLNVQAPSPELVIAQRHIGGLEPEKGQSSIPVEILKALPVILGFLTVPVLFLVLLAKRRIDFINGAILGGITFLASALAVLASPSVLALLENALPGLFLGLWVFLIWSTAESFLRSAQTGFTTSLDSLRAGRLGPRAGRSLLYGLAAGAVFGGFRLAALAAVSALPGLGSQDVSVSFPVFGTDNPISQAAILAGGVALALALAWRFLPPRWAPWVAALAGGLALQPVKLRPYPANLAVSLVLIGLLVFTLRRFGLTALLAAALTGILLPEAVLSGAFAGWVPVTFAVTAGLPVLLLTLGAVGLRRPEEAERERARQPAFIRRLEEERRLRYEMDLLARMQLGLLPSSLPEVPGWEIAVRSLLATEAGGDLYDFLRDEKGDLWIAAGDVAGHGYSCAIVQAMTAAALTSIVTAERTPSEVLQGVDRVIRRGGSHRNFTSLALVRLNPETGEVTMSNAGHPFPLLLAHGGEVEEISLPGLPLGQGPQRQYADFSFAIPRGGALVFCSDGLFEATDPGEVQYGYDRPRDLLRKLGDRPAAEILEALLADWRGYMRSDDPPADDTTVLVLKRL